MGNHEWCSECGASDFHRGFPCDPERKARVDAERAARREREARAKVAVTLVREALAALDLRTALTDHGDLKICKWDCVRFLDRKERHDAEQRRIREDLERNPIW